MNNNDNQKDNLQHTTLTVEEVAKYLNLAESTIYSYAKQGRLEEEKNPYAKYRIERKRAFTRESVEQLKAELQSQPGEEGLSLHAFCKRLNLSLFKMRNLLEEYKIDLPEGFHGRHKRYIVTPEIERQILDIIEADERFARDLFYNKPDDIALYQAFVDPNQNIYRVSRDKGWGFFMHTGFYPYNLAKDVYKLQPLYNIHAPLIKGSYTVEIRLPVQDLQSHLPYIDLLYKTMGVENLRMYRKGDTLYCQLKNNRWETELANEFHTLTEYVHFGEILIEEGAVTVVSTLKPLTIGIPDELYEQVREYAAQHKLDDKQALLKIVSNYLMNTSRK